jgi:hypothetical protein
MLRTFMSYFQLYSTKFYDCTKYNYCLWTTQCQVVGACIDAICQQQCHRVTDVFKRDGTAAGSDEDERDASSSSATALCIIVFDVSNAVDIGYRTVVLMNVLLLLLMQMLRRMLAGGRRVYHCRIFCCISSRV